MGATVHFLSPSMKLEGYLLGMESVTGRHTGEHIANSCVSLAKEFDIRSKVKYIVTDNAANMIKAFKSMSELFGDDDEEVALDPVPMADDDTVPLAEDDDDSDNQLQLLIQTDTDTDLADIEVDGQEPINDEIVDLVISKFPASIKQLRLSCGIHSLQLIIGDGMKTAKFLSTILSKASRLATLIHTSGTFADRLFAEFKNTIPCTNNTRWNSMFIQLQALSKVDQMKLQAMVCAHGIEMAKASTVILTKRETSILLEAVNILEPAYTATLIMEESEALLSLLAPTITSLHKQWQTMAENLSYFQSQARALLESLQHQFCGMLDNLKPLPKPVNSETPQKIYGTGPFGDLIYPVAAALDPECKLAWLDDWEREFDPTVKSRVTGNHFKIEVDGIESIHFVSSYLIGCFVATC